MERASISAIRTHFYLHHRVCFIAIAIWLDSILAHFGLPWVRPWDNRGKCHMDEKRIQCLSNALQHVFIPFPSNSTRKFAILAHFLDILASPGYAPGTIAVNIT